MDLANATEPLRTIAAIVVAVLGAIVVGLNRLATAVTWAWVDPVTVVIGAILSAATVLVGFEKGRSVVTPGPNVSALLASAEPFVEPADIGTTTVAPSTPEGDAGAALDAAAQAAGLD